MQTLLAFAIFATIYGATAQNVPHVPSSKNGCKFVNRPALIDALKTVVDGQDNYGLGNQMWVTIVSADGVVCEVAYSGESRFDQWRLSRVISAQKANTAASLCSTGFAFSTANLFQPSQGDQFLFGLQHSNPVNTDIAYRGKPDDFGTHNDPMRGGLIGGVNVFGGGLCLYNSLGHVLGGIGVSGDTSCGDHVVAWKVRHLLNWDYVPAGVHDLGYGHSDDNIIFSDHPSSTPFGFAHPLCPAMGMTVTDATSANNIVAGGLPSVAGPVNMNNN